MISCVLPGPLIGTSPAASSGMSVLPTYTADHFVKSAYGPHATHWLPRIGTFLAAVVLQACSTINVGQSTEAAESGSHGFPPASHQPHHLPQPIRVAAETQQTVCVNEAEAPSRPRSAPRAFFGMFVQACVSDLPTYFKVATYIVGFDEMAGYSPARAAGIRLGDMVAMFNGCKVGERDLVSRMLHYTAGNAAELIVLRRTSTGVFGGHRVVIPTMKLTQKTSPARTCADIRLKAAGK